MRGCLVKLERGNLCPKCGKSAIWLYDGKLSCADCLAPALRRDIATIEKMVSRVNAEREQKVNDLKSKVMSVKPS